MKQVVCSVDRGSACRFRTGERPLGRTSPLFFVGPSPAFSPLCSLNQLRRGARVPNEGPRDKRAS